MPVCHMPVTFQMTMKAELERCTSPQDCAGCGKRIAERYLLKAFISLYAHFMYLLKAFISLLYAHFMYLLKAFISLYDRFRYLLKAFISLYARFRYLLKALELYWHEDCLKCGCCDCRLGEVGSTLFTKGNLILCKRDYLRLFGTTGYCSACSKVIPAFEMFSESWVIDEAVVRFCVGDKFYLCDNKILCEYDYEERLVFASMACSPSSLAQLKRQIGGLESPILDPLPSKRGHTDHTMLQHPCLLLTAAAALPAPYSCSIPACSLQLLQPCLLLTAAAALPAPCSCCSPASSLQLQQPCLLLTAAATLPAPYSCSSPACSLQLQHPCLLLTAAATLRGAIHSARDVTKAHPECV
ncbi:hypothetical protein HAZT_HAZT000587 [Hyalella azteca]|uniref:LIM zinc-binding domain-containing protein n=1 Tax=Hyalella azteca TaxID=294128 RepID=A0A6A0H9Z0_HYAAZ|nr:hypothetical protein HAZT_HAZT000587 [Hyalella azteca]